MDSIERLKMGKKKISDFLKQFLSGYSEDLDDIPFSEDMKTKLLDYTLNGKMIRGSLVINSAELFWGKKDRNLMRIAASIELFQSALLIQDDIMDQDELRREQPSMHMRYGKGLYGESMALCLSDISMFLGYSLLSGEYCNPKIVSYASRYLIHTGLGQMIDVEFSRTKIPDEKKVISMYVNKTSYYTFILPLVMSAIYCGEENLIAQIEDLGKNMGLLFQIKDDLLGLYGNPEKTGKPQGSDIKEKKSTLYMTYLQQEADGPDSENISNIYEKEKITDKDVEVIMRLLEKYDIKKSIEKHLTSYKNKAFKIMKNIDINEKGKNFLKDIIEFIHKREK